MKTVCILGATGSIGRQTLDCIHKLGNDFKVVGLSAGHNAAQLVEQARVLGIKQIALASSEAAQEARRLDGDLRVMDGPQAGVELLEACDPAIVINATVGAAGLRATVAALKAGKRLGLANKESLVVAGDIVMPLSRERGLLLPVDSEHSAIFQCLQGENRSEVARFWITASGGPFRGCTREELTDVTPQRALAHPTWNMGAKISIDSATLMNKGLEVIEAHHLFGASYNDISVVVHPQSCVHSMVEYCDGSVKAHLGVTDMRIPIEYALTFPRRGPAPVEPLDFRTLGTLTFDPVDMGTFGCLRLALEAGRTGGTAPAILNAANEVAVAAFLGERIPFLGIEHIVQECLESLPIEPVESLEQLFALDAQTRSFAEELISHLSLSGAGSIV